MSIEEQNAWLASFVKDKISDVFESANFNLDVFKMAMTSLERKKERRRKKKEQPPPPMKRKNTIQQLDLIY